MLECRCVPPCGYDVFDNYFENQCCVIIPTHDRVMSEQECSQHHSLSLSLSERFPGHLLHNEEVKRRICDSKTSVAKLQGPAADPGPPVGSECARSGVR